MKITSYLIEAHIFRVAGNRLEFLLMKRAGHKIFPGVWQMVTGNINKQEKAYETALREIKEETGLTPAEFWVAPNVNSFYSADDDSVCIIPVFAANVPYSSSVILSGEHSEYKWLEKEEAKKLLAWKGQRDSVDIIDEYFSSEKSFLEFVRVSETLKSKLKGK